MTWRYVLPLVLAGGLVTAGVGCSNSGSTKAQAEGQNPGVTAHERPLPGGPGGGGPAKGAANKPKGID